MDISEHIRNLAAQSKTDTHELIEECLIFNKCNGTCDLTPEMVERYWEQKIGTPDWKNRMMNTFLSGSFA